MTDPREIAQRIREVLEEDRIAMLRAGLASVGQRIIASCRKFVEGIQQGEPIISRYIQSTFDRLNHSATYNFNTGVAGEKG